SARRRCFERRGFAFFMRGRVKTPGLSLSKAVEREVLTAPYSIGGRLLYLTSRRAAPYMGVQRYAVICSVVQRSAVANVCGSAVSAAFFRSVATNAGALVVDDLLPPRDELVVAAGHGKRIEFSEF